MPTFNYGIQPPRAVSGIIGDLNLATIETAVLVDSTGTSSGKVALQLPGGFGGSGIKTMQRTRTSGTRAFLGFVAYNPGLPGDPATSEYANGMLVPVCRQGRMWVYCENYSTDPISAADTWYARDSGGASGAPGNLRYGDDDSATCTRIPVGHLKAVDSIALSGGAALVLLDFNLRQPAQVGPTGPAGVTWRGAYAGGTTYAVNDLVRETGGSAPGVYIAIQAGSGHLPSTSSTYFAAFALDGA